MITCLKKMTLAAGMLVVTCSAGWAQTELTPGGNFETGTIDPAGTNAGNFEFVNSRNVDTWTISNVAPLAGAQSASLTSTVTAAGQNFVDQLNTNNFNQVNGEVFILTFLEQASANVVGALTVTLSNGVFDNGPGVGTSSATLNLTTALTQFSFLYHATTTGALAGRVSFLISDPASTFGSTAGDRVQLDNISVQVPELNAAASTVPLALLGSLCFLAYDRRRRFSVGTPALS